MIQAHGSASSCTGTERKPALVVAAMPEELRPLLARTRIDHRLSVGGCKAHRGTLGSARVILAHTGDGHTRAAAGLEALLERFEVRLVVVVGIAGGLSPALASGDLVVARAVLEGHESLPAPDAKWVELALLNDNVVAGTIVSTGAILCTPAAKAAAGSTLGNEPGTVDLESAAFARIATRKNVPYLVVRAVCDTADEALPFDLNECRDESGAVRRIEVVRRALLNPSAAGGLWRLRKRLGLCSTRLARFTDDLLNRESI